MDEPTVRSTKHPRPSKRRLPVDAVVVTVRVDDHRDGTRYASMASPDGQRWKAYAYWPKVEEEAPGIPIMWDADGTVWVGPGLGPDERT
jgi:hypothetical protein